MTRALSLGMIAFPSPPYSIIAGIVIGNVVVSLLMNRDSGLGIDELIAFGGGALLGVVVEFAIFRRPRR